MFRQLRKALGLGVPPSTSGSKATSKVTATIVTATTGTTSARSAPVPTSVPAPRTSCETLTFLDKRVEVRRRPYKRSIGVTLQVNGVIKVSAPRTASLAKIERFLETHGEWIRVNMAKYEELRRRYPPKRYVEGERFLFQGTLHDLRIRTNLSRTRARVRREGQELICECSAASAPAISSAIRAFYKREGCALLSERVRFFAERMQLYPRALGFRSQKTRWGSCTAQGRVSLNWRLIVAPPEVIDYVVIHELAHLRHHDHSRAFWSLVERYCPNYVESRAWLKMHQYEADFLARESELHPATEFLA